MIHEHPDRTEHGCYSCNTFALSYMVTDRVWHEAWPDYRMLKYDLRQRYGHDEFNSWRCMLQLCIACLEQSLGRKLTILDFSDYPINELIFMGFRMGRDNTSLTLPDKPNEIW